MATAKLDLARLTNFTSKVIYVIGSYFVRLSREHRCQEAVGIQSEQTLNFLL